MSKLANKVALVTGGNSGMGLATAKAYKDAGAQVIITARSNDTFKKAQTEYGSVFDVVQTDVSKPEDLDRLYTHIKSKYGKLDVVFANAGIGQFVPTAEADTAHFDAVFDTNVRGLFFTVAKALPLLGKGSSVILNASSLHSMGMAGAAVYSASKAAVRSFARSWTAEISPAQTRFNVISPGPIDTPIFEKSGMPADHVQAMLQTFPAKRFGRPEEIASTAVFLASDDSTFINGADIAVDGGTANV